MGAYDGREDEYGRKQMSKNLYPILLWGYFIVIFLEIICIYILLPPQRLLVPNYEGKPNKRVFTAWMAYQELLEVQVVKCIFKNIWS